MFSFSYTANLLGRNMFGIFKGGFPRSQNKDEDDVIEHTPLGQECAACFPLLFGCLLHLALSPVTVPTLGFIKTVFDLATRKSIPDNEITTLQNNIHSMSDDQIEEISKKVLSKYSWSHHPKSNSSNTFFQKLDSLKDHDEKSKEKITEINRYQTDDDQKESSKQRPQNQLTKNKLNRKILFTNYISDEKNNGKKLMHVIKEAVSSIINADHQLK